MSNPIETDTLRDQLPAGVPGLLVVFSQHRAVAIPIPLDQGPVELGREHLLFSSLTDTHLSRRHIRVRHRDRFLVEDLGSHNGTAADGTPIKPGSPRPFTQYIRIGDTLLIPVPDVARVTTCSIDVVGGRVVGPAQKEPLRAVEIAAREGRTVQIIGEHGAGKEGLARAFHAAGPASAGPLHVVRCSAMSDGAVEQLLFGNTEAGEAGHVRAAHGGTLVLEGVATLPVQVQASLLHLLVTGELLPPGGGRGERVDVRIAFTTRRELRADVEEGTLLEDLYYRLAVPRVTLPSLRDRPEEIPFLLQGEVARTVPGLPIDASLVEACLTRPWPGNVRELLAEAQHAAHAARLSGALSVGARHLDSAAGWALAAKGSQVSPSARPPLPSSEMRLRDQIAAALTRYEGNVSAAARELKVHRTQLRRWLERFGINPDDYLPAT